MSSPTLIPRPYPGIRPFEEVDSPIFFGREAQVNDLITKLEASRFVAVVGSSGSGKSSMVKAGLLPTLKLGLLREVDEWHSLVIRAGSHPFHSLAEQILRRHLGLREEAEISQEQALRVEGLAVELRKCPGGLAEVLRQFDWPPNVHFALVVDQFEEIFGFRSLSNTTPAVSRDDVERLVQLLLKTAAVPVTSPFANTPEPERQSASDLGNRVWTVLTMRSDFIGQCEVFPALAEAVSNSQFLVPVLDEHQKEDAIRRPGQSVPGTAYPPFEIDPALVRMIINDSGDQMDQLPLMQHSLMRTWARAAKRWEAVEEAHRVLCEVIPVAAAAAGPLAGEVEAIVAEIEAEADKAKKLRLILPGDYVPLNQALDQHAEDAWKAVSQKPALAALSKPFFLSLCDWSQDGAIIRRRPNVENVLALTGATMADLETVIRVFQEDERNFILPIITGSSEHCLLPTDVLDISHEAFLRQWQTYRIWQEENRKDIAELRDLCRRAQLFREKPARVLSQEDLDTFKKWKTGKSAAWALRYVKEEDWQSIDALFVASETSLWLAKKAIQALKWLAISSILGGGLLAVAAGFWAIGQTQVANKAAKNATDRITLSLQRLVGNSADDEVSPEEKDALWDIADLGQEHAPVRLELLKHWFSGALEFTKGTRPSSDGIGSAIGLSLEHRDESWKLAAALAGRMVEHGTADFDDSDEAWQFLGRFLPPAQQGEIIDKLLVGTDQGTASSTALSDLALLLTLPAWAELVGTADAERSKQWAERLVQAFENPQETASSLLSSLASSLAALASKLDAAAAAPLAERLVKALENTPETGSDRLSRLASSLAALTAKLDAAAATPVLQQGAERLVKAFENPQETASFRLYRLALSLAALTEKLDAAAAAPLAERLVKVLENTQETDSSRLSRLASSLTALTAKLDAAAAAPLAERLVKALENTPETGSDRLSSLASLLAALTAKLDVAAAAPLLQKGAERLVKALENTPETNYDRLSTLAALTEKIDTAATRSTILLKAMAAVISKWRGSQKLAPESSLLIHLCDWAQAISDEASRRITLQCMLQQLQSSDIPELENDVGPVIEPREREIVRKACLALTLPQLANLLKAPFCRGELQKLVLLALEQKTGRHFDGDLWKFVEAAATECYAGVDLDGPVKRIRLEEVIAEFSKHVPIPEAKPKASSQQP